MGKWFQRDPERVRSPATGMSRRWWAVLGGLSLWLLWGGWGHAQPAPLAPGLKPPGEVVELVTPPVDDAVRRGAYPPEQFAVPHPVTVTPTTHGQWETATDGRAVWRLRVVSGGATSLNLAFTRYRLPPGGQLVLYSPDYRQVLGPYTAADHKAHGELWTPLVSGGAVVLEVAVPAAQTQAVELTLGAVNRGFRTVFGGGAGTRAFTPLAHQSCHVDVACAAGDSYREQIRSVGLLQLKGRFTCSGVLLNNTDGDLTPYFLTAWHCIKAHPLNPSVVDAAAVVRSAVVYWNYQRATCGAGGPAAPDAAQSTTGATLRAAHARTDSALLELDAVPADSHKVYYAGWDRSGDAPTSAVLIHHPGVHHKSISVENDPVSATDRSTDTENPNGNYWRVADWDQGSTEPGSSGAPLFDQNKRVVGSLYGGSGECGNNLPDWFGRLSRAWAGGGTSASRLSDWLDPSATGASAIDGRENIVPAISVFFGAAAYTATEGGAAASVVVELSAAPERPISIPVTVTTSTATPGDYTVGGLVRFAATETRRTLSVEALDDAADDDGERLTLGFGAALPRSVSVGTPATTTVTLADNDDRGAEAPYILEVAVTSDPGGDGVYGIGDEIEVSVQFSKTVTVMGTPQLTLTLGSATGAAAYAATVGDVVRFTYTVVAGDAAPAGVAIGADSLDAAGTIQDGAARDASRTHTAVAAAAGQRVDGLVPVLLTAVVDGRLLTLTYGEALDAGSRPAAGDFTVRGNQVEQGVDSVVVRGAAVEVRLSGFLHSGTAVTVDYEPGAVPLWDTAGNPAGALAGQAVSNTTPAAVFDPDGDGLIAITTLVQLDALRHDLDGDGAPAGAGRAVYAAAFPGVARVVCSTQNGQCAGYELTADLDFLDVDEDGDVDAADDTNADGVHDFADTANWHGGTGWQPIGGAGYQRSFNATFEGNGHAIRHLFIKRPDADNVGLFGKGDTRSHLRRVRLVAAEVTGGSFVGGLVGRHGGTIARSAMTGRVTGERYVGGLVGTTHGPIRFSAAAGRVSADRFAGGLVGEARHVVQASFAAVQVSALEYAGGLVGNVNGSWRVTACYATGRVQGTQRVGGLVGGIHGQASITASYATGAVGGRSDVGGLVGYRYHGQGRILVPVTASYWDTTTSGVTSGAHGTGQTTAALQTPTGYTGIYAAWNVDVDSDGTVDAPWDFGAADEYPVLKIDFDGDGTATWQEFGYQVRAGPGLTLTPQAP